ncbi:type VI secretion system baseplate subunit TssK [Vibrio diabolicus]|uniref:type VI secretion system baseplate subunit TssK n=1 Tax=Vibrio diabolicus TaxID=50719 RepID=UPI0021E6AC4E|nr:type VI secretion system baseplate subunit TssK [Vibrio diabolicus]
MDKRSAIECSTEADPLPTGYVTRSSQERPFWMRLKDSGGIALHLSGHFPNADLELWSISQRCAQYGTNDRKTNTGGRAPAPKHNQKSQQIT